MGLGNALYGLVSDFFAIFAEVGEEEPSVGLIIRCGLCNRPIGLGEPVSLLHPGLGIQTEVTRFNGRVIGCMHEACSPVGMDFAGHWTSQGFRPAFKAGGTFREEIQRKDGRQIHPE